MWCIAAAFLALDASHAWLSSRSNRRMPSFREGKLFSAPLTSSSTSSWVSIVSTNSDLQLAINEVVAYALSLPTLSEGASFGSAVFFASTAYEAAAFNYDIIVNSLTTAVPSITQIIGCTSAGVIGTADIMRSNEPVEIENRASLSVLFLREGPSFGFKAVREDPEAIQALTRDHPESDSSSISSSSSSSKGFNLILSTESAKASITSYMDAISARTGLACSFGALSSSVSSYQKPKIFMYESSTKSMQKFTDGLVMLTITGDLKVDFLIGRSCVAVGPMFEITEAKGREILALKRCNSSSQDIYESLPPLVQLENVLNEISNSHKYGLTRELILAAVKRTPSEISSSDFDSIEHEIDFFSQKPIAFDPYTGSITLSSVPSVGGTFQFCVRESSAARKGVTAVQRQLRDVLPSSGHSPLSVLIVGSVERGNKVFKYQSWESLQVYHTMRDLGNEGSAAGISGLMSSGAFARLPLDASGQFVSSVIETDSLYAVISPSGEERIASSPAQELEDSVITSEDVMTHFELRHFSDETAPIIVEKDQAESSNTVRVAGMDYLVPDKMPQAKHVLEHLVWDRQKDADRLKERFPMARALTQAKVAEGKFPKRDLVAAIQEAPRSEGKAPILVEIHRSSMHHGRLEIDQSKAAMQMAALALGACLPGVVGVGVQTDISFGGQYEDLEAVKKSTQLPVICNDFVVYGYQLFRAKAAGADVVKLLASILNAQEMTYLVKTAKAVGLSVIVVVASKTQLLDVLHNVTGVSMIAITSRNHFLWKIDLSKADRILADSEVKEAIWEWKSKSENNLLIQEGFASPEDLAMTRTSGAVDAVLVGEEVLSRCEDFNEEGYALSLKAWIGNQI